MNKIRRALAFAGLALSMGTSVAQSWPTKPLRLVLGNAPGSSPDIVGRTFAAGIERELGQPMVIENRAGADGIIAAQAVARAEPDGYMLLMGSQQTFAISPHTHKSLPFDTVKDFRPIAILIESTQGTSLVIHESLGISRIQDVIAYAKKNPDKLTYSTSVASQGLFMEWFKRRAGIAMTEVRYKDISMATQDVVAGRVNLSVNSHAAFVPGLESGKLRLVTPASRERIPGFPDVPAVGEIFPDFNMSGFFTLMGPARLPDDVVRRLNRDTDTVVKSSAFKEIAQRFAWFNTRGAQTPEATAELIRGQSEVYRQLIRDIGLKPQ